MLNNDILKKIRFIFNLSDAKMIEIFSHAGVDVSREQVSNWLKKEDDPDYSPLNESKFSDFLDGFIIEKRGKKEGAAPVPKVKLNNNVIFRKLKIALNFKDDDILQVLKLADFNLSKHELSAFFRNPNQDQYRLCKDQVLRNFLFGLQQKFVGGN